MSVSFCHFCEGLKAGTSRKREVMAIGEERTTVEAGREESRNRP